MKQLAISIPTYNRSSYLKELLASIKSQIDIEPAISDSLSIYIFDNASTDNTKEIIDTSHLDIIYKNNGTNIGGDPNILQAYITPTEPYIWIIGDDEILLKDSISENLFIIKYLSPDLILNIRNYESFNNLPQSFDDYHQFAIYAQNRNPHLLLAHTLISVNIVRKECFNSEFALQQKDSKYAHYYAILMGILYTHPKKTIIPLIPTVFVRENRPDTNIQGGIIPSKYPETLRNPQIEYLEWVSKEYNLNINPNKVVPDYTRKLFYHTFFKSPLSSSKKFLFSLFSEIYSDYPILQPLLYRLKALYYRS